MLAFNMSHQGDKELAILLILETRQVMRTSCVCALKLERDNTKGRKKGLHKDVYQLVDQLVTASSH